jgi:hypothetical protein
MTANKTDLIKKEFRKMPHREIFHKRFFSLFKRPISGKGGWIHYWSDGVVEEMQNAKWEETANFRELARM